MTCGKLAVFPQFSGTCWFNAILMALFFSENTKRLLQHKEKEWKMSMRLKKIFKDILKRRSKPYEIKKHAYMFFKVITPEHILEQLNKENPVIFNFDPTKREGYFNTLYLPRLLEFLGISNTLHLDAVANGNKYDLYYSNVYNNYQIVTVNREANERVPVYKISNDNLTNMIGPKGRDFDVVTIRFTGEKNNKVNLFRKNQMFSDIIKNEFDIEGHKYINDSLLLTNFNIDSCKKGHDIAGITCEGKRYIYNGWMRHTQDRSMNGGAEAYPCEIMQYDWLSESIDFCLNTLLCKLDPIKGKELSEKVCFNASKGDRTYILVNTKWCSDKVKVPIKPLVKSLPPVVPDGISKKCPEGKIVNPKTGRCVNINGAIGKKISKMN